MITVETYSKTYFINATSFAISESRLLLKSRRGKVVAAFDNWKNVVIGQPQNVTTNIRDEFIEAHMNAPETET